MPKILLLLTFLVYYKGHAMSCSELNFSSLAEVSSYLSESRFSGHNFLDLKSQAIKEGKITWKSAKDPLEAVAFRSEDGSLHLYGNNKEKLSALVKQSFVTDAFKQKATVFTTESNLEVLQSSYPNLKRVFDFEYHLKPKPKSLKPLPDTRDFQLLDPANNSDLMILKSWYEAYNKEMNTNWSIPELNSGQRHLVMFDKATNMPLGFVSLTLQSTQRLWFGRFFIPKEARGKGAALDLLNYLDHIAMKENKELSLLVHTDNLAALSLYRKTGFEKVDKVVVLEAKK
jgi:RimJ/RimL family protein N-acetyltransferase